MNMYLTNHKNNAKNTISGNTKSSKAQQGTHEAKAKNQVYYSLFQYFRPSNIYVLL